MEVAYRVLVVDDDVELGIVIAEQLEAAGGFVVEAVMTIHTAEEACHLMQPSTTSPRNRTSGPMHDQKWPKSSCGGSECTYTGALVTGANPRVKTNRLPIYITKRTKKAA